MQKYIWVKNPRGLEIEVDASRWAELKGQGYELIKESAGITESEAPSGAVADLNYSATLWASNGMGRGGEEVLLALDRLGLKINVKPIILERDGLQKRTLELLDLAYLPAKKTLLYAIPEQLVDFHGEENYLILPWDTTKLPDIWVELINKYCKKIYPISYFTEEVAKKSGVTVPSMTVRQGVRSDLFPELKRDWNTKFSFLTCGDLSLRKGTDVLIEAFLEAFPKDENVELILKSNHDLEWGKIKNPHDKRVRVITDRYNQNQFMSLFREANCFVFPSRAEGFGLPALEAMSTGLPVIIHNWGGLSMMVNDKYNFPISSDKYMPAEPWHYPADYSKGGGIGNWRTPSKKELAKMMQYLYAQRDIGKARGELAAQWVRESWDWDTPISRMWKDMQGYSLNKWGDFYAGDTLTTNNVQASVNTHKQLFWIIKSFYPDKIIEAGCGLGEMAGWFDWAEQKVDGESSREVNKHRPKEIIAIDMDDKVLEIAKTNLQAIGSERVKLLKEDAFTYTEKADLVFAQGMLEHFSNHEMQLLVKHQLTQAPIVIHSVPNRDYIRHDFGDERLLSDKEYYDIFSDFDLTIYRYFPNESGTALTQSVLVFKKKECINFPTTSIIMPVLNQKNMTMEAINAVRTHTKNYELIVIDNNSTDGVSEWLDEQKDLRVIHVTENLGVPRAKNLALATARGKYICFLDNDTVAGDKWLETLLSAFDHPTTGFTGHEGWMIDKTSRQFMGEKVVVPDSLVEWVAHSVFVFKRETLRDTGLLYDKDLWCIEDVRHCCELRNLGYAGRLPPKKVSMVHKGGQTAGLQKYSVERFQGWVAKVWEDWGWFITNRELGAKIDIGVGEAPATGYLHVDIQKINHVEIQAPADKLPFMENTLEEVRNAHLIEHFTREDVDRYLKEWIRVLKPGGLLRVICPDISKVCKQVAGSEVDLQQGLLWIYGGQKDKYDFHYWGYNPETLMQKLKDHLMENVSWKYNENSWLEVTGTKPIVKTEVQEKPVSLLVPKDIKVGLYISHSHTYGGGENYTFQVMKMLQNNFPRFEVVSEYQWEIDPKKAFNVDLKPVTTVERGQYDLFFNLSHFKLTDPPMGKKNVAIVFYPQYDWTLAIHRYTSVITISDFCKEEILRKWKVPSYSIPPAVEIDDFAIGEKKKQIVVVGRFFHVEGGNNKNQLLLLDAFRKMPLGWKMIMVGTIQDNEYYNKVKEAAVGLDVEFRHGISFNELKQLYSESEVLWHGAGYDAKEPSSQEHFGIVAVEALASGARALVFNGGGMSQISGVETWNTLEELVSKTLDRGRLSPVELKEQVSKYSPKEVEKEWLSVINKTLNS